MRNSSARSLKRWPVRPLRARTIKILIMGLRGAGKTTLAKALTPQLSPAISMATRSASTSIVI